MAQSLSKRYLGNPDGPERQRHIKLSFLLILVLVVVREELRPRGSLQMFDKICISLSNAYLPLPSWTWEFNLPADRVTKGLRPSFGRILSYRFLLKSVTQRPRG
jgi:hypothetical protein